MCPRNDVLGFRSILRKYDICEIFDECELKEYCQNKNEETREIIIMLSDI